MGFLGQGTVCRSRQNVSSERFIAEIGVGQLRRGRLKFGRGAPLVQGSAQTVGTADPRSHSTLYHGKTKCEGVLVEFRQSSGTKP